jgi:hypothetical protein
VKLLTLSRGTQMSKIVVCGYGQRARSDSLSVLLDSSLRAVRWMGACWFCSLRRLCDRTSSQ